MAELERVSLFLLDEQSKSKRLDEELEHERETIEDLLTRLDFIELGARASKEETLEHVSRLEMDLRAAKRTLDDERTIRLQLHYESNQSKGEAEGAVKDKLLMQKAQLKMENGSAVLPQYHHQGSCMSLDANEESVPARSSLV